jgi:transcriptional regulator of acetoin/glycerol metabolism
MEHFGRADTRPRDNELLGAIGLSGSFRRAHPHTLSLVSATARLAEAELAERHASRNRELQACYLDLVARSRPGRSALVNKEGVARLLRIPARQSVRVRSADDREPIRAPARISQQSEPSGGV